jgi:predicted DNA-binding transcriptional regulator YafY
MENTLRAPLVYIAKHRGYTYEDKTYVLPHLFMTDEEKGVLRFLVHRYRQYNHDNAEAVHRVAHLLERFTGEQETEMYSRLPAFDANPRLLEIMLRLSSAIRERRTTIIQYINERLSVQPLRLLSQYNSDYLSAYCENTSKVRLFRLEDISVVTITDSGFDPSDIENGKADDGGRPTRKPFMARMRLPNPLIGQSWNGYAARLIDEPSSYEIEFFDIDAFLQHLINDSWDEILAPKWLREKLRQRCLDLVKRIDKESL